MNILIISRTPWNQSNSFGNTFTNLFKGMDDINIFHICCQAGETQGTLASRTIQLTDSSVLRSLLGKDAACIVNTEGSKTKKDISDLVKRRKTKNNVFFHLARDMIWQCSKWVESPTLFSFLEESHIDLIYLPIYASCYICDIQFEIIKFLNKPVVAHITDDVYHEKGQSFSGHVGMLYQKMLQKRIRRLLSCCSYIEVFAENMLKEYERIFQKPCFVIGKGVSVEDIPLSRCSTSSKNTIVYTGGLGAERYKVIALLAKCIDEYSQEFEIHVYSKDTIDGDIQKAFVGCKCIKFKGVVDGQQVRTIQRNAEYLLHVESFSEDMIEATRMSFSTKIIDYMMTGNTIIAIGPPEVNSISILKEKELAIVVDDLNALGQVVGRIVENNIDKDVLFRRVREFLLKERNINMIQAGMRKRMENICK